jgi:hypothetical protein
MKTTNMAKGLGEYCNQQTENIIDFNSISYQTMIWKYYENPEVVSVP